MPCNALSEIIDRMVEIKEQQSELKSEYSELEVELLKQSAEDLKNTKNKSVTYQGTIGNATATMADSVKIMYPTYLQKIFGDAFKDIATEKVDYKLTAPAARLLSAIWKEDFIRQTPEELLSELEVDDGTRKILLKKLKGTNFEKDKDNLITVGKLPEDKAEQYAFFFAEAVAWQNFIRLLSVDGAPDEERIAQVMALINTAIIVEETPKVAVSGNE